VTNSSGICIVSVLCLAARAERTLASPSADVETRLRRNIGMSVSMGGSVIQSIDHPSNRPQKIRRTLPTRGEQKLSAALAPDATQFPVTILSAQQLVEIGAHDVALRNGKIGVGKRVFDNLFRGPMAPSAIPMKPTA
jgi:hypothetical protein